MTVCPEGRASVTWARKNRLESRLEPMLTRMVSEACRRYLAGTLVDLAGCGGCCRTWPGRM